MPKSKFELPSVSPLMGSTMSVFNQTLLGNEVAPEYKKVKRNTRLIISALTPLRKYEALVVDKRARLIAPDHLVFIIGHWRSGTTFLHNLMCQAFDTSYVSTYQTVFANYMGSQPVIKPLMKAIMPDKRPADNMRLEADLPQEEEFAFSNMNPYSYYRYMYFPRNYDLFYRQAIHFEGLTQEQRSGFLEDYKLVLSKALLYRPGSILVVKNPVHTARLKWLREHFPQAKYIHIYRDPHDVYRSTMRFFSALLPTLWFHKVDESFLSNMIMDVYRRLYHDYFEARNSIQDLNIVDVRYEDFVQDPMNHIRHIYQKLELPGYEESKSTFEKYCSSRRSYSASEYSYSADELKFIREHLGEYIDRWGYH